MNEESGSNTILLLNSGSRIAFVLHHILGYPIKKAAGMAQITEKQCRAHLRDAYLQLAALKVGSEALANTANADAANGMTELELRPSETTLH